MENNFYEYETFFATYNDFVNSFDIIYSEFAKQSSDHTKIYFVKTQIENWKLHSLEVEEFLKVISTYSKNESVEEVSYLRNRLFIRENEDLIELELVNNNDFGITEDRFYSDSEHCISLLKIRKATIYRVLKFLNEIEKQELEKESNLKVPDQFQFENKFDKVKEDDVIQYFVDKLVDKKLMTRENLESYLKQAFELKTLPEKKISFTNNSTKDKIRKIFYNYYVIAGTPYGRQTQYLQLLTNYFTGFEKMSPKNFSR